MPSGAEQTVPATAARGSWRGGRAEGLALLAITACSWGLNWPLMKFLMSELPPFTMRSVSFVGGLAFALALALGRGESLRFPREQAGNLLLFSLLNYGLFGVFTALSLWWLRSSEAVVITYTLPVWAALLAWPMLGERPTPRRVAGMVLALAGVAALVGAEEMRFSARLLPGVACGFLAAFLFGLGTVVIKRQPLRMPPVAGVVWQIGLGFIPTVLLAALLEHPDFSRLTPVAWLCFAYIAIMPMTVAYLTWFRALRLLPASIAATSVLLSPLVGVLSSALLLGDPLGPRQLVALAITLTGVGLAARS
ncbi:MAG TPA: DMT family transporter [Acetobacteraceae bacterium]|nr:DMT family transporter [Acetobacteraceae bacterium]